jgi:GTP-binding protein
MQEIRNIAIIAHVDHGKTTLVDALLKQSENFKTKADEGADLILDNNALERERGITILSKNVAINYKGIKVNIVDTPGHADFGGEVERIMRMVDGVLLLVDAKEGPMPQTKFVLKKAIEAGHRAIVVINKIDKPSARTRWVLDETFNLFVDLGATDEQANFPVIYAAGLQGKAGLIDDLSKMTDIAPLFETIVSYIKPPEADLTAPTQFLTVNLAQDSYKGKIAVGRLYAGSLKAGQQVMHINREGKMKKAQITSLMVFNELQRKEVPEVFAGDIVAIAGIEDISIGETIADVNNPKQLPPIHIDEPTLKAVFYVNKSPFAGKEGEYVTSRNIKERLFKEVETDVALKVAETTDADRWVVSGRGELHLSILIERMRREGYELAIGRPQVIYKEDEKGDKLEPIELAAIEVPNEFVGAIMQDMGSRLGKLREMRPDGNITKLEFVIPTRGLIGYRSDFMTRTKGQGIMNTIFFGYEPYKGDLVSLPHGSLVAHETGTSTNYGLMSAQERGHMFIGPGVQVYQGMIVGINAKDMDLVVNVCREKQLSNMRSKGEGAMEFLDVPLQLTLEDALEYIADDELVEVTPKSIRMRKIDLKKGAK